MEPLTSLPRLSQNIALIGNSLPRRCGIATFTTDLLTALASESAGCNCHAVVMNDVPEGYLYPRHVRFEVNDNQLPDYKLAADFLNVNQVNVVCLQHEYGIFGGSDGAHLLTLLQNLRRPIVTTLHTVLPEPEPGQRAVLQEIGDRSDRLVVMSHKAEELLQEVYGVPEEKIALIHHGIPDMAFVDPSYFKDQFGVEGRKVILSFGLLSPGKGIEYLLDALPEITRRHPEAVCMILGATHPHVKRESGESYRLSLQLRARELGVEAHVIFHNRFVELKELCEFLGAADIYVTPYLSKDQIVSGTLAYALGAGKATVSTPYWYAEEMLAEGRGRIVPFRDAEALAEQVIDLLDREVERHAMRKRAYSFCRQMIWKEVARRYLGVFEEVQRQRLRHPRPAFQAPSLETAPLELPRPKIDHLRRLTDDVGIIQHARFIVPQREHGYCTDDNARALIAVLIAQDIVADADGALRDLNCRYLSFLCHAFHGEKERFRNFMGYDRRWLEDVGSEDCHGRAVWSLGLAVALEKSTELGDVALGLFKKSVPTLTRFTSPRAWAFGLVGMQAHLRRFEGDSEIRRCREVLARRLYDAFLSHAADEWPWIENTLTYDNGKIPQALLAAGTFLKNEGMIDAGLRSLEWLFRMQTGDKGEFAPIGNRGWYPRDGERAWFDQQPIEAQSLAEAAIEAFKLTQDEKWLSEARRCLEWFLGRNDLNIPLYDYNTGGCRDGLGVDGANRNQGAESTVAWLLSLLQMYAHGVPRPAVPKPVEATANFSGLDR